MRSGQVVTDGLRPDTCALLIGAAEQIIDEIPA
jgi:hypothetical protein